MVKAKLPLFISFPKKGQVYFGQNIPRAGNFQNYVIYMKNGELLHTRTSAQVAIGLVGDFKYNQLTFLGIAK